MHSHETINKGLVSWLPGQAAVRYRLEMYAQQEDLRKGSPGLSLIMYRNAWVTAARPQQSPTVTTTGCRLTCC